MSDTDFTQDTAGEENIAEETEAPNGGNEEANGESQGQEPMEGVDNTAVSGREDDRKLFVGGLSWETTDKDLKEYFGKYGDIDSVNVKTDPMTGRSRGFAFIIFKTVEGVEKSLSAGDHIIGKKKVEAKHAKARQGKVFVGGLPIELTDEEVKEFFGKFGKVVEVEMPFDKVKNQRKGFCFITFDSEETVREILKNPRQTIGGKECDIKKATPRGDFGARGGMRGGRGGPMGGRGGGAGGWNGQWGYGAGGGAYDGYGGAGYGYGYDGYYGSGGYGGYDYYGQNGAGGRGRGQRFQPY